MEWEQVKPMLSAWVRNHWANATGQNVSERTDFICGQIDVADFFDDFLRNIRDEIGPRVFSEIEQAGRNLLAGGSLEALSGPRFSPDMPDAVVPEVFRNDEHHDFSRVPRGFAQPGEFTPEEFEMMRRNQANPEDRFRPGEDRPGDRRLGIRERRREIHQTPTPPPLTMIPPASLHATHKKSLIPTQFRAVAKRGINKEHVVMLGDVILTTAVRRRQAHEFARAWNNFVSCLGAQRSFNQQTIIRALHDEIEDASGERGVVNGFKPPLPGLP